MRRLSPLLLLLAACGSSAKPEAAPPAKASSGSPIEMYFPLEQGKQYTYATRDGAETGMITMRVERTGASHGKLVVVGTSSAKRFAYEKDGIAYEGGAYILKAPIEVGTSWPGEHGGTAKITKTDLEMKVGDKTYAACIQTSEDGTRPPSSRYTTTYCPGVGMVLFEVVTNQGDARGELKSYGDPVKIEQGTTVKMEKN